MPPSRLNGVTYLRITHMEVIRPGIDKKNFEYVLHLMLKSR
jgi:hypothetical protein